MGEVMCKDIMRQLFTINVYESEHRAWCQFFRSAPKRPLLELPHSRRAQLWSPLSPKTNSNNSSLKLNHSLLCALNARGVMNLNWTRPHGKIRLVSVFRFSRRLSPAAASRTMSRRVEGALIDDDSGSRETLYLGKRVDIRSLGPLLLASRLAGRSA